MKEVYKMRAHVGYKVGSRFLDVINVCFDEKLKNPIYTISEIDQNIDTVPCSRIKFAEEGQYGLPKTLDYYYNIDNQQKTINSILQLPSDSSKYISKNGDEQFFSRGHLIAKTDLMTRDHQLCTFFYINTAPQWQPINGRSWSDTEKAIRDLAKNRAVNLKIVAGTHGILQLKKDETGIMEQIYLYKDGKEKALPVPEFFWKFVYESNSKAGVVIVSTNSPINGEFRKLCTDVCSQLTKWIAVDKNFAYCCSYDDFEKKFRDIPNYEVKKLLI